MSSAGGAQLADVNVLIALLWPRHVHHAAAQAWFAGQGHQGWATNAITQPGAIRLLTNPAVTHGAVSGSTALATLSEAMRHPKHQFWPMEHAPVALFAGTADGVTGHRQWTDLFLLRHAVEQNGKLVTFDGGISLLADKQSRGHLVVLEG